MSFLEAARRERERGRAATSAAASRLFTDKSAASKLPVEDGMYAAHG